MDALGQGFNGKTFQNLHQALLNVDQYMALADFASYSHAQQKAEQLYKDQTKWNSMSLVNTAKAGIFAADRAIRDYANTIGSQTGRDESRDEKEVISRKFM